MRVELSRLHRELAATMVYVTHDQVEAMTMADRIVVLNEGRVEQFGTPMELYHHPATRFVATFIGQPNMNLIPAKVTGASATEVAAELAGGHQITLPVDGSAMTAGDNIDVGIRPEDVAVGEGNGMHIAVDVVERLGGSSITYGTVAGTDHRFCAELPGDTAIGYGENIQLQVAPSACHAFASDGQVLRRNQAPALVT